MGLFDKIKTDLTSFDYNKVGKKQGDYFGEDTATGFTPDRQPGQESEFIASGNNLPAGSDRDNQDNLPINSTANKKLEDRLDEVDAIYNQNNGNKALRGDGLGFDQPFIIKDIGDSYPNLDDGIVRGGAILSAIRAAEDVIRLTKYNLTPRGVLWNLKQVLLQKQNAMKDTRKYNPLRVLGSSAPMVHISRHTEGFNPFADPPKYDKVDDNNQTIEDGGMKNLSVTSRFVDSESLKDSKDFLPNSTGKIKVSNDGKLYSVGVSNMLQVPYGGKFGDKEFAVGTDDNKLPKDFIKFKIRDAVNGKWLVFPAMLGTITDTVSPEYTQERYIGRPDAVHIYTGTNRNVTFDFKVAAFTKQEIPIIQEKMNYLIGLGYPHYKNYGGDDEMRPVTPYINLTIGDLFNDTPGYFNNITCTMEETSTWELDEGFQIPKFWNVSVDFVYIGKYLPHSLSKHYEVPWLKDEGITKDTFGTFGTNNPTEGKNSRPTINGTQPWSESIK